MKYPLQPDHRHEHAGQETTLQRVVVVGEALLRDLPPAEHLGEQQEGTGVLRVAKKKSSGNADNGHPGAAG